MGLTNGVFTHPEYRSTTAVDLLLVLIVISL